MTNTDVKLTLAFHRAYSKLCLRLDEDLGAFHGIDFEDYALLHALADAKDSGTSLPTLAVALGLPRSSVLRRTRPLEKTGLIVCEGNLADRRARLTPAGRRRVASAGSSVADLCANGLAFLSADEIDMLKAALPAPSKSLIPDQW